MAIRQRGSTRHAFSSLIRVSVSDIIRHSTACVPSPHVPSPFFFFGVRGSCQFFIVGPMHTRIACPNRYACRGDTIQAVSEPRYGAIVAVRLFVSETCLIRYATRATMGESEVSRRMFIKSCHTCFIFQAGFSQNHLPHFLYI